MAIAVSRCAWGGAAATRRHDGVIVILRLSGVG